VGINSQIYSRSGGFQGVSFSIPIDVALNVSKQLQTSGKVTRGKLGVTIQAVNQQLAQSFGLAQPTGALVSNVEEDSAAAKAGVQPGDVILAVDGKPVQDSFALPSAIASMQPGAKVELTVWRDGKKRDLTAKLEAMDDTQVASADEGGKADAGGRLGVAVRPLTSDEKKQIDVKGGLVVEDVAAAAAEAGIRPGDVLLSANGKTIDSAKQLREIVEKSDRHIAVLIQRGEARIFVPVDLG
jgi:serine protease Do